MYEWIKWLHLVSAIVWLGGMTLLLFALRPVATHQLAPHERLNLMCGVLSRFFAMVWVAIACLIGSGFWMFGSADLHSVPRGWHAMSVLGSLMCIIFAYLWFSPFQRLKKTVASSDWPAAGKAMGEIHPLVIVNFTLGWVAVTAAQVWR